MENNKPEEQSTSPFDFNLSFRIGSDKHSGIICLQDFVGKYQKDLAFTYFNTRDAAIRGELIKLGWTPPQTDEQRSTAETTPNTQPNLSLGEKEKEKDGE